MSSFSINITHNPNLEELKDSFGIFLYRATRIPPHLGWFINGKIYDITTVGPTLGLDLASFYQTSVKRKMEVVFIALDEVKLTNLVDLETKIETSVRKHEMVSETKSCLAPILEVLEEISSINSSQIQFFFDLYPFLMSNQLIKFSSQLGLDNKLIEGKLALKTYTQEDIKDCIAAIERKSNLVY
ncbi:MAG: hypothetical protein KDD29_04795 [Flavobacteriales bacterium]|nr:hypothetical protein [Flavobacteriales bacterium]MCB9336415.1 hypothetical protein [Flavobacteriales bacterium]